MLKTKRYVGWRALLNRKHEKKNQRQNHRNKKNKRTLLYKF